MNDPKWTQANTSGKAKNFAMSKGGRLVMGKDYDRIEGPNGSVLITADENMELDRATKKNLWKWFKLIGILTAAGVLVWYFWPALQFYGLV